MPIPTTTEMEAIVLKALRELAAQTYLERHLLNLQYASNPHYNHMRETWFTPNHSVNIETLLMGDNWNSMQGKTIPGATPQERLANRLAVIAEYSAKVVAAAASVKAVVPTTYLRSSFDAKVTGEVNRIKERLTASYNDETWQTRHRGYTEAKELFTDFEGLEAWLLTGIDALTPKKPKAFSPSFRKTLNSQLGYDDDAGVVSRGMIDKLGYPALMWLAKAVHTGSTEVSIIGVGDGLRLTNGVDSSEREKICGIECARAWRDWCNRGSTYQFMRYMILDWEDFMDHVMERPDDLPVLAWSHCLDTGASSPADWLVDTVLRQLTAIQHAETMKAKHPNWADDEDLASRLSYATDNPNFKMKPLSDVEYMLWNAKRYMEEHTARYIKVYDTMRATELASPGLMASLQDTPIMKVFEVFVDRVLADSDKLSTLLTISAGARQNYSLQLWHELKNVAEAIAVYAQHRANAAFNKSFRAEIKRLGKPG